MRKKLQTGLLVLSVGFASSAAAYDVDGNVSDWFVNASSWDLQNPDTLVTFDDSPMSWLNQRGGHKYDTEVILADVDWGSGTLYVAAIVGTPPDWSDCRYPGCGAPGDLAIYVGDNYLAYEGQDGWYNKDGNYGLVIPNTDTVPAILEDVLADPSWKTAQHHPTSIIGGSGTVVDQALVAYTDASFDGTAINPPGPDGSTGFAHYAIEAAIPIAAFDLASDQDLKLALHWTMGCANDWMNGSIKFQRPPGGQVTAVPEPGPMALMLFGLGGIGFTRRRRHDDPAG